MLTDLCTIVIKYVSKLNILKLRFISKKFKTLVYKYGLITQNIRNIDTAYQVIKICKRVKLEFLHYNCKNLVIEYDITNDFLYAYRCIKDETLAQKFISIKNNIVSIDVSLITFFKTNNMKISDFRNLHYIKDICYEFKKDIKDINTKDFKNLTHLDLTYNNIITDTSIENFKNLTSLDLSGNNKTITDAGIEKLKKLTSLNLSYNKTITDAGIEKLKNLTSLNISSNYKITYLGIKNLKKLKNLVLSSSYNMSCNNNSGVSYESVRDLKYFVNKDVPVYLDNKLYNYHR